MGIIGIADFLGIGLRDGGYGVGAFYGALHHIDAAGQVQDSAEGLRQPQDVVEEVRIGPALIFNVVNGKDGFGIGEDAPILRVQIYRNHSGLPVVGLDDIGIKLKDRHGVQYGFGKIGIPLAVV